MENVIKQYLNTIEPLISTFATIKTVDVVKMLHKIDEYHESELKKLRVGDVIKNEVSVCDCTNEWHESNMQHFGECHACGLKAEY